MTKRKPNEGKRGPRKGAPNAGRPNEGRTARLPRVKPETLTRAKALAASWQVKTAEVVERAIDQVAKFPR